MTPRGRRRQRDISTRDLTDYGSPAAGTVNIDAAARGMGVARSSIRRGPSRAKAALSSTLLRRLSGRREADVSEGASARGMLQAAYGRGPRGGAVNANAAAQALGVSPGTVRRWAAGTQQPTAEHLTALRSSARRATRTKAGRRAATADFRASPQGRQALRVGSKLWISGTQGPRDYPRQRDISVDISPQQLDALLRAYEQGGDRGLIAALADFVDTNYLADWEFLSIDDLSIGEPE